MKVLYFLQGKARPTDQGYIIGGKIGETAKKVQENPEKMKWTPKYPVPSTTPQVRLLIIPRWSGLQVSALRTQIQGRAKATPFIGQPYGSVINRGEASLMTLCNKISSARGAIADFSRFRCGENRDTLSRSHYCALFRVNNV